MAFKGKVLKEGCCILLTEPTDQDLAEWASWFNNPQITENMGDHEGKLHTVESQRKYWREESLRGRTFVIARSASLEIMGVLTSIPISHNNSFVSVVFPKVLPKSPFAALEATSLFVEYIFKEFHYDRISVGQRLPVLKFWTQRLFLIGFQYEGIELAGFSKDDAINDVVRMGITRKQFDKVMFDRGGSLWPGDSKIISLWNRLNELLADQLNQTSLTDYFAQTLYEVFETQKTILASIYPKS